MMRGLSMQHFLVLFCAVFILFFPFPYHLLPAPGNLCLPLTSSLAQWTGQFLFQDQTTGHWELSSDSSSLYYHSFNVLILSGALFLLWKGSRRYHVMLQNAIVFYLSLQLFKYGFDKVCKGQFYFPEPLTLYTPLGQLDKDMLFWSSMGSSYLYNMLTGGLEVLVAFFLVVPRTRRLGSWLSFILLSQVFLINISFDISVKLYSLFLLLCSALLISTSFTSVWHFMLNKPHKLIKNSLDSPAPRPAYTWIQLSFILCFCIEAAFPYVALGKMNHDHAPKPFLYGAYQISNSPTYSHLFIHKNGHFILRQPSGKSSNYILSYDLPQQHLILQTPSNSTSIAYKIQLKNKGELLLIKQSKGATLPDSLLAKQLNLHTLPLHQDTFHWTVDQWSQSGSQ